MTHLPQQPPTELQTPGGFVHGPPARHGSPWWLVAVTLTLLGAVVVLQQLSIRDTEPKKVAEDAAKGLSEVKKPHISELVLVGKLMLALKDVERQQAAGASAGGSVGGTGTGAAAASPETGTAPAAEGETKGAAATSEPGPGAPSESAGMMVMQFVNQAAGWEPRRASLLDPGVVDKDHPPKQRDVPSPAADRLRATVLAGEVYGPDELAWRLNDVEKSLDPSSALVQDVRALRVLYRVADADGKAPAATELDPVSEAGLRERHGWFADLALTRGDENAPVRAHAAGQGMALIVVFAVIGAVIALATVAGIVILIIGLTNFSRIRPAFVRPEHGTEWPVEPTGLVIDQHGLPVPAEMVPGRGGAVWLETVAIFLLGFLTLKLIGEAMAQAFGRSDWFVWVPLLMQWVLLFAVFWPRVRGMSRERWRDEIGWRAPRGVMREVGAGVLAYLATVPLYIMAACVVVAIVVFVSWATGAEPGGPRSSKIVDIIGNGGVAEMIAVLMLATVWAPIVEESIFRGALYRHLRRRTGVVVAALGSAGVFAVAHPYPWFGWIMVGVLGFSFAIMREWRGSLIPSATAHAIHNGFVTCMLAIVFGLASV